MDVKEVHETGLHIKLTNKGTFLYGGWSKERLLSLLRDKLIRQYKIELSSMYPCNDAQCDASLKSYHSIIHSGIYNECVLIKLEKKSIKIASVCRTSP